MARMMIAHIDKKVRRWICQMCRFDPAFPEDDLPLWCVHEIDEVVVNVGIAETVFPYEELEVRTGANGDFIAELHQCSAQCDTELNITSCTNRHN